MQRIVGNFLFIPKNEFTEDLENRLIIENPNFRKLQNMAINHTEDEFYILYKHIITPKGREFVRIPRYCFGDTFVHNQKNLIDIRADLDIDIKWNEDAKNPDGDPVVLNKSQRVTVHNTIRTLIDQNGCVTVAETGEGKTTMGINLLTYMKKKTLILVHKDSLAEQWIAALMSLTNLKKKEIGYLRRGKFKDGKVVIGSQQSLMNNTFPSEINDKFGLIIQDEVHLIGAQMFLKSFVRFNARYRLGLSATPDREDGLEEIYEMHIGRAKVFHTSVRTVPLKVIVEKYHRLDKWKWYPPFIPEKTALINNLVVDKRRIAFIGDLIHNVLSVLGRRKVIVFSERVKQLKELMKYVEKNDPYFITIRFFGEEKETVKSKRWVFTFKKNAKLKTEKGEVKILGFNRDKSIVKYELDNKKEEVSINEIMEEGVDHIFRRYLAYRMVKQTKTLDEYNEPSRDELLKADVIFATYSKAKDGLDLPPCDTEIYATPFGSSTTLRQTGGRIKRKHEEGVYKKTEGLIIDVADMGKKISEILLYKRIRLYKQNNVEIVQNYEDV